MDAAEDRTYIISENNTETHTMTPNNKTEIFPSGKFGRGFGRKRVNFPEVHLLMTARSTSALGGGSEGGASVWLGGGVRTARTTGRKGKTPTPGMKMSLRKVQPNAGAQKSYQA